MLIEVKHVSKIYRMGDTEVRALDDVSLNVEKGEFVAIIGPSGSGKSTLMNILGCLDSPSEGDYIFDGKNVSKLTDNEMAEIRNKNIGFVFQNFNLLPKLTALENVELPLIYAGQKPSRYKKKAMELLNAVGLSGRIHHKPTELSGGQQQRVAIARALATDPSIILADEPTGNLDTKSGVEIMNIFQRLNEQGKTIIIITHDPSIAGYCKRMVHIQDGKIIKDEKVEG
ncbi:MAG: ABC transporter ATP-binding protein [Thermoanaerobacteraceae bacterium]|nr:ABC transporter ATP-binding protein [Thermoanaerobacteraceae bacterium]